MSVSDAGLLITTDAVGGVWSYSIALARGLAASGTPCVLAVMGPHTKPEQQAAVADIEGCRLVETGLPLDWTLTSREELDVVLPSLIALARASGCTGAHVHAPALSAQPWPMPVVAVAHSCMATWWDTVHGSTLPSSIDWHRAATCEGLARADEIVAPSRAFAAVLQRIYRSPRPITVIHNGLPPSVQHSEERETGVLAAGRLWDAGKNIGVLDEAAGLIDVPVRVAGSTQAPGGARSRFSNLQELGVLTQDLLNSLMASSAIFAAPSVYEPFGLAVLEAAQQASALVLSDIPTFRELWSDAAVFVPPDQPARWAATIRQLANDTDRIKQLGQAAVRRSLDYTQDAMVAATLMLHRKLGQSARQAA